MRLRVHQSRRRSRGTLRRALEGLRLVLLATGAVCLAIFAWLQFERYYFESRYLSEFDRQVSGQQAAPPTSGELQVLGRLRVSRLDLEVAVLDRVDDRALRRGAGWIPGTARPGEEGNVGLAAHRDTFFRPLRKIRNGDRLELDSLGETQSYVVRSVKVVEPDYTAVLEPTSESTVTLVTCFPFDYVGAAPRRYIVQAVAEDRTKTAARGRPD